MATTRNATYKQYNGTDWDTVYFRTSAGLVGERDKTDSVSSLYFLRPETHTVNGKSFYGTSHQGITLYAGDIKISSTTNDTIITLFQRKVDTDHVIPGDDIETVNDLAPYGDDYAVSAAALLNALSYYAPNDHDHDSTYAKIKHTHTEYMPTGGGGNAEFDEIAVLGSIYKIIGDDELEEYLYKSWADDLYAGHSHTHSIVNATTAGFMSADQFKSLNALSEILLADENGAVDKINEVFAMFDGMDDETTIIKELQRKVNTDHVISGDDIETVNDLAPYGDDYAVSAAALLNALGYYAPNDHDHDSTYAKIKHTHDEYMSTGGGGNVTFDDIEVLGMLYRGIYESGEMVDYDEYVTQSWVENKKYATESWVQSQRYSTTKIFTGSTTPSSPKSGDIWINY